ncbi:transporter substrate-binding domain-containing protein [Mitsuaria sp. GD03876]|uniref:substrate-binding periplasmic protein n=1 Tax=Mitsuaria sp. GD03876 TaxID=2975399 RepID=UPI00244ABDBE|nr:transporter substrate-binding domain-containing protein [Mitsuaria sp. GD03876]MDH0862995.1 transporter substrate-binding domain-containing protein [Mitsuaria sp. GD03876]
MRTPIAALAASAALVAAAPALACGPYTVGFYEYSALYYRDAQGHWAGIDKDVVDEIVRRSGCQLVPRTESRIRIWAQIAAGQLDMTVSALQTKERELLVEFIPYVESKQFVVMRPALAATLTTPAAFLADRARRVIVVRGYVFTPTVESWITAMRGQGRVDEAPDQTTAMRIFKAGRGDAVVLGAHTLATARRADPVFAGYSALSYAPHERSIGALALSRQRIPQEDRDRMREAVREMERDGSLEIIKKRHLADLSDTP